MAEERSKSNDLVLVPGEYAYVRDGTKGAVEVFVGPHKAPLSESDRVVIFGSESKRFEEAQSRLPSAHVTAPEGWYIQLKNPAAGGKHPPVGARSATPELLVGQKLNIPGPDSFALWPGQMARVIQGHALRSNQYLLVRVYNEQAAKESWSKAVIKVQTPATGDDSKPADPIAPQIPPPDLTMGQCLVIRGTDVAFYIPPTGIEVVWDGVSKDEKDKPVLVRDAVTLESLEYCTLLDQDGNKRIEQGPAVVIPKPTEIFVEREVLDAEGKPSGETLRKFRAIELNDHSGIYVKVIAPYEDASGQHEEGEELFITGKEQRIYFPREEHAIIRYSDRDVHYAIAVPDGEAKYVLNRDTGEVRLAKGPLMFLPDPRREVVVRRVLDQKTCEYLYPGNREALEFNVALERRMHPAPAPTAPSAAATMDYLIQDMDVSRGGGSNLIGAASSVYAAHSIAAPIGDTFQSRGINRKAGRAFAGDAIVRNSGYSEPRTITLDTKYRGAVSITPWIGYATLLVRKNGQKRVVIGPETAILEYDEEPQVFTLSTGKPKTTDALQKHAYLCVSANKVSDVVYVETRDLTGLNVKLSYRVNFEGDDPAKWFSVDNYVKFMCDHMRSRLRNAVMAYSVEEFYGRSVEILRDVVLGESLATPLPDGAPVEGRAERPGAFFEENAMRIYDVEVLGISFADTAVQQLLVNSQREAIQERISLETARRKLSHTEQLEEINRKALDARDLTAEHQAVVAKAEVMRKFRLSLQAFENAMRESAEKWKIENANQKAQSEVQLVMNERQKLTNEAVLAVREQELALSLAQLTAETKAVVDKATAFGPDFIAALQAFSDQEMMTKLAQSLSPMALLGGGSVAEVIAKALEGTGLSKHMKSLTQNGTSSKSSTSPIPAA